MKKKISAVLLAVIMVLSVAACAGSADRQTPVDSGTVSKIKAGPAAAYNAYSRFSDAAAVQSDGAVDMDFIINVMMDMSFMGGNIRENIDMRGNVKTIVDGDMTYVSINMDMGALGGAMEIDMAMEGGRVTYFAMDGVEYDVASLVIPCDYFGQFGSDIILPEIDIDSIITADTVERDGKTVATMVVDGDELLGYVFAIIRQADESLLQVLEMYGVQVGIDDVTMTIVSDQDMNPERMTMDMRMGASTAEGGETMAVDCEMAFEVSINALGDDVVIPWM